MNLKKRYYILASLALLLIILLFSLSSLVKRYLINNSEELIGRKINIGELHFNYALVSLQVQDFVMYETSKVDSFISFKELYINFNPWMLASNEYNFSEIRLVSPKISIIQDNDHFNFTSLIAKDDSIEAEVDTTTEKKILKFTIHNLLLGNGEVKYFNVQKSSEFVLNKLNLNLPLLAWDNEKSNMGVNFLLGEKGQVNINGTVDNINQKYQIDLKTDSIDISSTTNYIKDYLAVSAVSGFLATDVKILGDLEDVSNLSISGLTSVSNLNVIDNDAESVIAFDKLTVDINNIDLQSSNFDFRKIELMEPKIAFEQNRGNNNFQKLLQPLTKLDTVVSNTSDTNAVKTKFKIDTLYVTNGKVNIADKTLNRPFYYTLSSLNFKMKGLSEVATQIPVDFSMLLNNEGELKGATTWSMLEPLNLKFNATIKRMNLTSLSPYSEFYIASPMNQGWLSYDIGLDMNPTSLVNSNNVLVDELEFGKRTKDSTATKVPVRLGLYLMKDVNDQIKIELPITGNPSDPEFRLGKIIWKSFGNLMYKMAASPFNALASLVGTNPESLEKISFTYGQDSITEEQREKLTQLATIVKKKPDLFLTLTQTTNPDDEKDQIALLLAKQDYLNVLATDTTAKQLKLVDLKDNDPKFINYLRKSVSTVDSIGVEKACRLRADASVVDLQFKTTIARRNSVVEQFLKEQGLDSESIKAVTADLSNLPVELLIPQYKIEVSIK